MFLHTDFRQVVHTLSDALDLVGVDDVGHGKRVGIMAAECAAVMGLGVEERAFLFDLGLLHDIGVSSTRVHRNLVTEFDWPEAWRHCRTGHDLLADFGPLSAMARPILHHHTPWKALQESDVPGKLALRANLILLTDRVDALSAPFHADNSLLSHAEEIRGVIRGHAGTFFAPELVDVFLEASRTEAFWLRLEARAMGLVLREQLLLTQVVPLDMDELRRLALIFSRIVDAKSPFTAEHSAGVARVARLLGELLGLDGETCVKLEVAGLLHDLGKLRVADEILDKPDRLDREERFVINTHTFETYQILSRIPGFEEITAWAAYHHEEPDGSGYPFHLSGDELTLPARIMRVADIFQAMVQDRPYRRGLEPGRVREFMRDMADAGRIDREVADVLDANIDQALKAATTPQADEAAAWRAD
jgi:HD-GYP domain-containing protein (c-di-GMP phosphodiesterase class II)